jgi:hypothetical protein
LTLNFNRATAATLPDATGQGTGFTTRLPGSGAALTGNDPSLTLDTANGHLLINSTRSDFNLTEFGRNLTAMEAPAIFVSGAGSGDFMVRAKFIDVQVDQLGDQMGVFVGTSVDNVTRAMFFDIGRPGSYTVRFNYSLNGVDGPPTNHLGLIESGDGVLEFGRVGGLWRVRWTDSQGSSAMVWNFTVPGIDSETDLYFGVFNNDARNTTPQVARLDYFQIGTGTSIPEPASYALGFWVLLIVRGAVGANASLRARVVRSLPSPPAPGEAS